MDKSAHDTGIVLLYLYNKQMEKKREKRDMGRGVPRQAYGDKKNREMCFDEKEGDERSCSLAGWEGDWIQSQNGGIHIYVHV